MLLLKDFSKYIKYCCVLGLPPNESKNLDEFLKLYYLFKEIDKDSEIK